jgi:hypothetical protein
MALNNEHAASGNGKPKGFQMQSDTVSGNAFDLPLLKRLFTYVRPYPNLLFAAVALTILAALLSPLRPHIIKLAIDNHIAIGDTQGLFYMSLIFLAVVVLEVVIQFGNTYFTQLLGQKAVMQLRLDIFKHLQKLSLKFFDRNPIGRLITRATNDVETLNEMLSSGLVALLGDVFQLSFIIRDDVLHGLATDACFVQCFANHALGNDRVQKACAYGVSRCAHRNRTSFRVSTRAYHGHCHHSTFRARAKRI